MLCPVHSRQLAITAGRHSTHACTATVPCTATAPVPAPSQPFRYPNSSSDLANPIRVVHFGYHVTGRQHDPWLKHTWDCFDVHKDVVAAPLDTMNPPKPGHQWPADLEQYVRSKSKLLMYSGWVPTDYVGWMPGRGVRLLLVGLAPWCFWGGMHAAAVFLTTGSRSVIKCMPRSIVTLPGGIPKQ